MSDRPAIVFLPGVMGSRLYFPDSNKFWDPDSTWRMLRWAPLWPVRSDDDNRRELHAREPAGVVMDPLTSDVDADGVAHGWGGVVWSYYGDYLKHLRTITGTGRTFAVGYDWRQDIRWLGEYAADKFWKALDATGADKLAIVTHSMGGLVARAAFMHDPTLIPRVAKVLFICQPATGVVILYRRLFTGLIPGLDGGLKDYGFRLLLGNTRAAFVGNMSGLPGAMQLLPSEFYPDDAQGQPHGERGDRRGRRGGGRLRRRRLPARSERPHAGAAGRGPSPTSRINGSQDVAELPRSETRAGSGPRPAPAGDVGDLRRLCRPTRVRIAFPGNRPNPAVEPSAGAGPSPLAQRARPRGRVPARLFGSSDVEHATACANQAVAEATRVALA